MDTPISQSDNGTSLRFLIIHPSRVIKDILRNYIRADHPDALITETDASETAARYIAETRFDIIFSGLEMAGMGGLDVWDILAASPVNAETPLVVMTATDTPAVRERLASRGIPHVLPLPCTSVQFRETLFGIFNPRSNIRHTFYAIPNSRVLIRSADGEWVGRIVDIGHDRMICELPEFPVTDGATTFVEAAETAVLQFPADYGKASTINLVGRVGAARPRTRVAGASPRFEFEICWERFELHAATKRPLSLGFGTTEEIRPPVEQDSKARASAEYVAAIARLEAENRRLEERTGRLKARIVELEKGLREAPTEVSLDALINEAARPTDDSAKRSIFKRLVDENIKLRDTEA